MQQFVVSPGEAGRRLDQYLCSLLPDKTRSAVQRLIEEGFVQVDGKPAPKNQKLRAGSGVTLDEPEPEPLSLEPEDLPLPVVYEDDDLLVVNKPKGMVVHPAPGNYTGTLVNALLYHCKDSLSGINGVIRPGIVHRIDKDTSGLLIVAKNDRAHQGLAEQIQAHSFDRFYEAVVYGNVKEDQGTVRGYLGRHPQDRKKMAVVPSNASDAREAITHYRVLERFQGFTYIQCRLETGRTHQIRVHMASLGHPVAGDPVYGPKKVLTFLKGQCLHAKSIAFTHPVTGERLSFDSPLPEEFAAFLQKLRRESGKEEYPMEKILLAVDCDGTLLKGDKTISERNLAAVRRFKELGGAFTLATGRSIPTASSYMELLEVDQPVILYNGAMVYDPKERKALWCATLPEEVKFLPQKAQEVFPGVGIEILSEDNLYAVGWNDLVDFHLNGSYPVPHRRCRTEDVMDKPWIKILFAMSEAEIPQLIRWLEGLNLPGVQLTYSDHILFEVLPLSAGKGKALRRVSEITGFPLQKIAAMGDFYNDLEMLQLAGFSAVPSNACDAAKEAADYVAADNERDAVAEVIDYILEHPAVL